jgi:hypothetical protein
MYGLNLRKDKIKLCVSHGIRTVSVTKYTSAQRKHLTGYSITFLVGILVRSVYIMNISIILTRINRPYN